MCNGKFTELTFINDDTAVPINAENLNELERVVKLADTQLARPYTFKLSDYLEYFWKNNVLSIEVFDNYSDWTSSGSVTLSNDTTNKILNFSSVKMLENDATGSTLVIYQSGLSLDLTSFNDSSISSSTEDMISLVFYVSDITKFDIISFRLGTNSSDYYGAGYSMSSFRNGWNTISIKKSNFTEYGSPPAWSNITYLQFDVSTENGATNEYVCLQLLTMTREDATYDGYPNPFQLYDGSAWNNEIYVLDWNWLIAYDSFNNGIVAIQPDQQDSQTNAYRSLSIFPRTICFICQAEFYIRAEDELYGITWRYDDDNYIQWYIASGTMYIREVVAGSPSTSSLAMTNTLVYNDKVKIYVEKYYDVARFVVYHDGEQIKSLERNLSLSTEYCGYGYFGYYNADQHTALTDFIFTNTQGHYFENWDKPKLIKKAYSQTINDDSSMTNDEYLYAYLPPNSVFEVYTKLAASGATGTDIKTDWELTGSASQLTTRACIGPALGTSDNSNTNVRVTNHNLTTDVSYGTDNSSAGYITERFLVRTGDTGGKIQMRWAQNSAAGTDTTISSNSYMVVTKLEC